METLLFYLLKSSGLIMTFFLAYHFLLRKETFFSSNRWFLLFGLVTSVLLPLVTFTKVIWVEAAPKSYEWNPISLRTTPQAEPTFTINWFVVFAVVYGIGLLLFLFKFFFDFKQLRAILKGKTMQQKADLKFIDVAETVSPFSYFNYIVYNSALYSAAELENILEHEKVHCEQKHSIDVLMARVFCILFWYNPFIWWYKRALLQNLEFIADSEALKKISYTRSKAELNEAKKAYQITLLKVTTHANCVAITNPFYQSLIKKRIVMLNKNQSKKWNSWKYVFIVPVLIGFLLYFQVNVIAQEKPENTAGSEVQSPQDVAVVIDKNTTDEQLKTKAEELKTKYAITLKFSKIKRNTSGEIVAIKAVYKDKDGKKGTYQSSGDEPIQPIRFFKNDNGAIGFGTQKTKTIIINKDGVTTTTGGNNVNEDIVINEDLAEAPEAPEAPEVAELPETPEAPEAPNFKKSEKVVIRTKDNGNGKMTISVNGETITIDTDKILADIDPIIQSLDFDEMTKADRENLKRELRKIGPAMRKSTKEMVRIKRDPERMKKEMVESNEDIEQSKRDIEQSKRDIEQAKLDLEQAKRDFEQSKKDFEQAKKELEKKKTTK